MTFRDPRARWYLAYYGTKDLLEDLTTYKPDANESRTDLEIINDFLKLHLERYEKDGTESNKKMLEARRMLVRLYKQRPTSREDAVRLEVQKDRCKADLQDYVKLKAFRKKLMEDGQWLS